MPEAPAAEAVEKDVGVGCPPALGGLPAFVLSAARPGASAAR